MLLALSNVTYVLIGLFKFLLIKFLYEYGPSLTSLQTDLEGSSRRLLGSFEWHDDDWQAVRGPVHAHLGNGGQVDEHFPGKIIPPDTVVVVHRQQHTTAGPHQKFLGHMRAGSRDYYK